MPDEWDTRTLPKPLARVCFAAIEKSDRFRSRWNAWRRRLGIAETGDVTLLADGAKWIWEEHRKHLTHADGVLDVFHAVEHIADAARTLHGGDGDAATAWTDAGRTALLAEGIAGIDRQIDVAFKTTRSPKKRKTLQSLRDYLQPHERHLNDADRLATGRGIGSGQVEGAGKNLIGRRIKQTGARWRLRRVDRMTGPACAPCSTATNGPPTGTNSTNKQKSRPCTLGRPEDVAIFGALKFELLSTITSRRRTSSVRRR